MKTLKYKTKIKKNDLATTFIKTSIRTMRFKGLKYASWKNRTNTIKNEILFVQHKRLNWFTQNNDISTFNNKTEYGYQLFFYKRFQYLYGNLSKNKIKDLCLLTHKLSFNQDINLILLAESRLQQVIYKLNFSKSEQEARHLLSHNFFTLNNSYIKTPHYLTNPGDIISYKNTKKNKKLIYKTILIRMQQKTFYWNPSFLINNFNILTGMVISTNLSTFNKKYINSILKYCNVQEVIRFCKK